MEFAAFPGKGRWGQMGPGHLLFPGAVAWARGTHRRLLGLRWEKLSLGTVMAPRPRKVGVAGFPAIAVPCDSFPNACA
jgi:hypothetical protein